MFEKICGEYPLWDADKALQAKPEFSPCFEDTVLVWIPYGYLWITLIPYLLYLKKRDNDPPLPWTPLIITKTILTVFLFCLAITDALLTNGNGYRCTSDMNIPSAIYLADGIKGATFILILVLEHYMRILGVKSSGVPFVFWLLATVAAIVPVYSVSSAGVWCSKSTLHCIEFGFLCIQVILRCFADQYKNRGYHGLDSDPCPEENASVLNKITFSWITSLIVKAYKQTLTSKDLWTQTRRLQSKRVVGHFLRNWKLTKDKLKALKISRAKEHAHSYSRYSKDFGSERTPLLGNVYSDDNGTNNVSFGTVPVDADGRENPSIFKVVIKSFGWMWVEACGYKIIGDAVNLMQPLILSAIIDVIEKKNGDDALPVWIGFTYAVALFITSMIKSLVWQTCLQNMIGLGLTIKTALIGAVYRKALTLSNSAKKSSTVGEIVNLMSVDCQRVQDAFTFSHHIVSLPFVTIVAMVQLWTFMGVAMFGGLAVVLLAIIINGILGRLQQRLQIQILRNKSKRVKILNEVINGIKVLKMYTWEIPFQKKVTAIRAEELSRLWKYAMLTAVAILFSIHSPFMVNYMLVLVYTLMQSVHYLDAQTAFVVLSLVNILRGPITLTPFVINGVIQGYVSLTRIQTFLWKEDINEDNISTNEAGEYRIDIENGSFAWDRNDPKPTLTGIDLKLREGQIYAVVGQVGCGKSSLISSILGEMEKLKGNVNIKGKLAYVPQEAWIQNLTVRDNIIFGNEWDLDRYNKVLTGCAMVPDLEMLSGGDMTEIGEKGINISGGQKQRVSLARAVYSDADIYLLDDPLSAVDSHVGKHLFKNVIGPQGLLKRKTRILVTHGIHWLPMVDKILVMTNGHISETGTYEELISRDGPFANLVQTYLENDEESDADDTDVHTASIIPDDITPPKSSTKRRRHKSSEREKSFGMSFTKEAGSNKDMKKNDQLMSRLVQEEQSQKGAVKFAVFQKYAKSMGYIALIFVMVFMVAFQSLNVFSNYWLTYWTEDELMKNVSLGHTSEYENRYVYYLVWYTVIGVIQGGAIFAFGALALTRMVRASGILHNSMLECILRSPMSFFDTTPVGRIMNRFSSDIDVMDDRLPLNFRLWNIQIFSTIATIIVVSISTPIFLVVIVPVTIVYLMLLKFFLPTARQVKRLESVLRSPIYNHFSETITGVSVIRAYKCMDRFIEESEKRIDTNIKFFFAALSASRWIAIRLETLGNILILAAAIFALISTGLNGAQVGLSITYALQITISLNLVIQAVSEMEMNIVSAERVKEYTELSPEAPWSIRSRRPSRGWPRTGSIEFRLFRTRYRDGLELTLKGISCQIRSGEKVGIVGRTGAGKSSLALSLFRLIESAGGAIIIDGQNIGDIGLHDLRSKLTILPQDPVLFSGTLRENLDPFGRYDEHLLWEALKCAHLKAAVDNMSGQLEYECGEGGSNLSVGQRQLVCLARTLLHKTKILILDEATAAVDLETDELIQATIRTEFSDCTILTIAHRLNTVLDYDRVLVLSEGKILEIDAPNKLLQDPSSVFFKMAKDAGLVS